jgi:hypothetical protein
LAESPTRPGIHIIGGYAVFISTAALLVALFALPAFRVARVTVRGPQSAVGSIESATGIIGDNIFTIRAAAIATAAGRIPNVLVCGVTVSLPNTVSVCARLRRPVLGWKTKGGLFLVDKFGRVIATVDSTSLPVLRDTTRVPVSLGRYVSPWVVLTATTMLRMLPDARIKAFTLKQERGLVARSSTRWKAVIGDPESGLTISQRIATLKALIARGEKMGRLLRFADLTGSTVTARFHRASPLKATG